MSKSNQTGIFLIIVVFSFFSQNSFAVKGIRNSVKDYAYKICHGEEKGDQKKEKSKEFSYAFSGSVNLETFYDSRQVKGDFYDEYVVYPLAVDWDPRGLDINSKDQFNMVAFRAYLQAKIFGPKVWGAKTSAKIQGKFTGVNDTTVRLFRLNSAYVQFDWKKTSMMIGHHSHPIGQYIMMNGVDFRPYTLSAGYGRYYDPFLYASQIRFQHRFSHGEFMWGLVKHYKSFAARLSITPDFFGQLTAQIGKHLFGFGINYHIEEPLLLETIAGFKESEQLASVLPFLFAVVKGGDKFLIKSRLFYCENGNPFNIMGAYAVKCIDEQTDERGLVNSRTIGFWFDAIYNGKRAEPALFLGITKNIGASDCIQKSYTMKEEVDGKIVDKEINLICVDGALTNADKMFMVAPRIRFRWGPMMIGAELEYSRVWYACNGFDSEKWKDDFDCHGKVVRTRSVSNTRILVSTRYFF